MKNLSELKSVDVICKEWFDRINGNSYFSARIILNGGLENETVLTLPFKYGYGNHYEYEAVKVVKKFLNIPLEANESYWKFYKDNNIKYFNTKHERCLKREVVNFAK